MRLGLGLKHKLIGLVLLVGVLGLPQEPLAAEEGTCYISMSAYCWYYGFAGPYVDGSTGNVEVYTNACMEMNTFCDNWCQGNYAVPGWAMYCGPHSAPNDNIWSGQCDCDIYSCES
jgi:hypothetical protein